PRSIGRPFPAPIVLTGSKGKIEIGPAVGCARLGTIDADSHCPKGQIGFEHIHDRLARFRLRQQMECVVPLHIELGLAWTAPDSCARRGSLILRKNWRNTENDRREK